MKALKLALRFLRRDWRSGELRLLALALVVAVAAVTAVGFFSDRVEQAMQLQANEVLAADLVLTSHDKIPPQYESQAATLGLQTANALTFPSVVMQGERTQLIELKAVSDTYPLRGELRTRLTPAQVEQVASQPPQSGMAWAGPRLLAALQLNPGDTITLGDRQFQIERILSRDSATARSLFRLGPALLIPLQDIPATGLVTPASRVHYNLLIAGPREAVEQYRLWAQQTLPHGISLQHMSNANPQLRNTLDQGSRFLSLAALVAVLVAGATVALSTRRFVENQSDTSAIMRCLGASQSLIFRVLMLRLLIFGNLASLTGILVGFVCQFLLARLLADWFGSQLPAPGIEPVLVGLGTGMITLIGFTLPPALRLGAVPPLRVLRRDLGAPPSSAWLLALSSLGAMALLMLWQAGDIGLAIRVIGGSLVAVGLLLLCSRLLILLLSLLRHRGGALWRYGLAGLIREPGITTLQLTGFGLGIMAILLLTIIRVDLLQAWQKSIPDDAPNQFLVNIQLHEVDTLQTFLQQQKIDASDIYPMLRARLTHINEHQVSADDYTEDRAQRLASRDFNLSWALKPQHGAGIVSGRWWGREQHDSPLFSVEQGLAQTLGIKLEDTLQFELAGVPVRGRVANLRTVRWDSFQPNFFVIGTPGLLRAHPTTYITSFHLPPGNEAMLARLIQAFPAVTIIDVSAILQQLQEIMARGSQAVEYVFLFSLGAALLMLYAGIQASREHRRQESVVLRTLGVQRKDLLMASAVEFLTLGLLSGSLATLCANLTGWFIAKDLLGLAFTPSLVLWLVGVLGSGVIICTAGILATYPLTIRPPLHNLQAH